MRVIGSFRGRGCYRGDLGLGPGPIGVEPSREVQDPTPPRADADVAGPFRFEPTGLSILRPYGRGKIPVVLSTGSGRTPGRGPG